MRRFRPCGRFVSIKKNAVRDGTLVLATKNTLSAQRKEAPCMQEALHGMHGCQLHKTACFAPLHRPLLRKTVSFVGAQRRDIASHLFRQITCVMAPASPEKLTERAYHRADSMQHINKV